METEKRKYNVVIKGVAETEDAEKVVERLWKEYRERILNAGENAKKYSVEFVGRT